MEPVTMAVLWWHWMALGLVLIGLELQSPNAKTLLLPADVLRAVPGLLGRDRV